MEKVDYKKRDKELYLPKQTPSLVNVPEMTFIMVDGAGDPNTAAEYQHAMNLLYGLSYAIKMSKMDGTQPDGYFEYVVPPLEGFWEADDMDFNKMEIKDKNTFRWTSMIRQPEFVTHEVFQGAKEALGKKKPELDLSLARLEHHTEGLCAQILHIGPYDDEPETVRKLSRFIEEEGYCTDINQMRRHHEIYLGDPRKTAPEKLKTVIRHPVRKNDER